MFPDGATSRSDLPGFFTLGATLKPIDKLSGSVGFNHFQIPTVRTPPSLSSEYYHGSGELKEEGPVGCRAWIDHLADLRR
jgi:hypothetical protein